MNIAADKIMTLVDQERDGLFVHAFCPICDHAEEAKDVGGGKEQAAAGAIAKIQEHIRKAHRARSSKLKVSVVCGHHI